MKRLVIALALMCALSTSILAGEMPTGGKSEQPPPAPASTSTTVLVSVILTVLSLR